MLDAFVRQGAESGTAGWGADIKSQAGIVRFAPIVLKNSDFAAADVEAGSA
jgi:hypothetical protein